MPQLIFGINPVIEALKSEKPPDKIFIQFAAQGSGVREIILLAKSKRVLFEEVSKIRFAQMGGDNRAQGVAALISEYEYRTVAELLEIARERNEPPLIALLDNIEDPHNLGAIIRSAECLGVHGIVIPKHRAVNITETVSSSSAGALAHLAVVRVTNLVSAIEELKAAGLWIVGADHDGDRRLAETDLKGPTGIVLGSEGKGMRRLVKEACDFITRIPMKGRVNSLNVSVAAAVLFYEAVRQRQS
jgi:23S rRNA (guanosine2251-2'-O)-methyltransferase